MCLEETDGSTAATSPSSSENGKAEVDLAWEKKAREANCTPSPLAQDKMKRWTREEVAASSEMLFIIEQQVYRIPQQWAKVGHPGGEILLLNGKGSDISIPFVNNHRPDVVAPILKRFHAGEVDTALSPMETEFIELVKDLTHESNSEWFTASPTFYIGLVIRYFALLGLSIYSVLQGWVVLGAILMGFYFQQVAFIGHDLGHNGVTHNRKIDELIGFFFGNATSGISVGWWKATHNVHHMVTNSVEYDPDIQHMPAFAITPKFFENIYSLYHFKTFEFDKISQWLLRYQHIIYYPLMAVARVNLYLQSFLLVLPSQATYRKRGGNNRMLELAALGIFWSWFSLLLYQMDSISDRILFFFISHAIAGVLHIQITISHFPMPVIEGNPLKSKQNFIEFQLAGSLDVDCPSWMDWFHGGLQFQAVHHLIPRIPRHNLRRLRDEIIVPFCEKHNLEYKRATFTECNRMVLQTLKQTADQVSPFLLEGLNAAG